MRKRAGTIRRKYLLLAAILAAAVAYVPARRAITAVRLLLVVRQVASGEIPASPAVQETRVIRKSGPELLGAVVYRPAGGSPSSGILLIPGVSELGCDHPRLVSLARALAKSGFFVVTPDIRTFREFQIYPPPLDEISFWLHESARLDGGQMMRRIGLAGISFSGTLALIAAGDVQNRGRAAYVLAIGAFEDLMLCSRFWFDAGPVTVSPGYYPTRYYAKWVLMLAAADLLAEPADRAFVKTALRDLLLQKAVPAPTDDVTETGRRWLKLAVLREDASDPELALNIENRIAALLYPGLDTGKSAAAIRCPVFLAHGAYDDLIPPEESIRLQKRISSAKSYLLISPFLTHTHPWEKPLDWWTKVKAVCAIFAFFYHLAGVL